MRRAITTNSASARTTCSTRNRRSSDPRPARPGPATATPSRRCTTHWAATSLPVSRSTSKPGRHRENMGRAGPSAPPFLFPRNRQIPPCTVASASAMPSRSETLARLACVPADDPDGLHRAASAAMAQGCHEEVRARLLPAVAEHHPDHAGLWQMLALACRGLGESAEATRAFARAAELRPGDPLLAHSIARTTLEGGGEAVVLFENAVALAPGDGSVRLGRSEER